MLVNKKKVLEIEDHNMMVACAMAYSKIANKVFAIFFLHNAVEKKLRKKLSDVEKNKLEKGIQRMIDSIHENPCRHVIKTRKGEKDAYECIDLDTYKCKLCGKVHRV